MPKFAANLSMMFGEVDFMDRFDAAALAGFKGVEFLFPYDHEADAIAAALSKAGLSQALFNLPPGDCGAGDRGFAAIPGREATFDAALDKALAYASVIGNELLHVMSGIMPDGVDRDACTETLIANLKRAAPKAAAAGKTLIIEPINTRDIPGYFLNRQGQARAIIEAVGADNVGLQFDFYHCQIVEGDLAKTFEAHRDIIRHVQIAGVPERHEPNVGEINYPYLFDLMDRLGYHGWVGCEYRLKAGTVEGLSWMKGL
ncbi:MAG: hydroxypyruvate isomerase family protein [Alphaproteobacteria bacterium]|nr:hydroxypyruvate isomerase family protein [Alphaproteobacteria bacterium]